MAAGKELRRLDCGSKIECAVFVNGGKRVLCAGNRDDPTLQLWDIAEGKRIARSAPVDGPILGIAPLPDGAKVVPSGRDGMIRLWQWKK